MTESVRASAHPGPDPASVASASSGATSMRRPLARRLALSVVADGRAGIPAAGQLARLAARLELAGTWWREPPLAGPPGSDLAQVLDALGSESPPGAAGLIADARHLPPASISPRTTRGLPFRLALHGTGPLTGPILEAVAELAAALGGDVARPAPMEAELPAARPVAAVFVPLRPDRDLVASVAAAAAAAAGRPVLAEVTVSVGRTTAEARARADNEEVFALSGHPREQGLFGTLEECQACGAALLEAGATELVCHLPRSHDLPDVLAQLRAISIGASALRPGEPPSAAPPPPAGWGGRRPGTS